MLLVVLWMVGGSLPDARKDLFLVGDVGDNRYS